MYSPPLCTLLLHAPRVRGALMMSQLGLLAPLLMKGAPTSRRDTRVHRPRPGRHTRAEHHRRHGSFHRHRGGGPRRHRAFGAPRQVLSSWGSTASTRRVKNWWRLGRCSGRSRAVPAVGRAERRPRAPGFLPRPWAAVCPECATIMLLIKIMCPAKPFVGQTWQGWSESCRECLEASE